MDKNFLKLYNDFLVADKKLQERLKKKVTVRDLKEINFLQSDIKNKYDKLNNYKLK